MDAGRVALFDVSAEKYDNRKTRQLIRLPEFSALLGKYLETPAHPDLKVRVLCLKSTTHVQER